MTMRKMTIIVPMAVGYVLGARAGRERYEQIKNLAWRVKSNPTVQHTARQAAEAAKDAAPVVKDKVAGAADAATQKVRSSDDTATTGSNGVPLGDSSYPKG
jgi:hypothetical protein